MPESNPSPAPPEVVVRPSDAADDPGLTARLARFVADTSLADVPADVVERTKHLMLDGLACGLLAAKLDWSCRAVQTLHSSVNFSFDLANGVRSYPGFGIGGEAASGTGPVGGWVSWQTGTAPPTVPATNASSRAWLYGSGAIQYFLARDPNYDPRQYTTDSFRERMSRDIRAFNTRKDFDPKVWDHLCSRLYYTPGKFGDQAAFARLHEMVKRLDGQYKAGGNVLFYMATPPSVFGLMNKEKETTFTAKLLGEIRKHGRLTKAELYRAFMFQMSHLTYEGAMKALVEGGMIRFVQHGTTIYVEYALDEAQEKKMRKM